MPLYSVSSLTQGIEQDAYFSRFRPRGKMTPTQVQRAEASVISTASSRPETAPGGFNMSDAGAVAFAAGAASAAIGALFSVRAEQSRAKAQALSLEHEASMAAINARQAEVEAQSILQGSHRDIAAVTLQAGQDKAALRAQTGGAGLAVGAGSAGEVQASIDLVKELDTRAIRINAVAGAGAARMRRTNQLNTALLGRVSARNLRGTAGNDAIGATAATASLLDSGGRLWAQRASDRYRDPS